MEMSERPGNDRPAADTKQPSALDGESSDATGDQVEQTTKKGPLDEPLWRIMLDAMKPRYLLSHTDEMPVVLKQFGQLVLLLLYPVWVAGVVVLGMITYVLIGIFWVLLWPFRRRWKRQEERSTPQTQ